MAIPRVYDPESIVRPLRSKEVESALCTCIGRGSGAIGVCNGGKGLAYPVLDRLLGRRADCIDGCRGREADEDNGDAAGGPPQVSRWMMLS